MNTLYTICIALSAGVLIGVLLGGLKSLIYKKKPTQKQLDYTKKLINKFATALKYITLTLLSIGLIWCIYFLILGITVPTEADYANSMAELIVSVLTVISIIFAFVEFVGRKR